MRATNDSLDCHAAPTMDTERDMSENGQVSIICYFTKIVVFL